MQQEISIKAASVDFTQHATPQKTPPRTVFAPPDFVRDFVKGIHTF